MARTYFSEFYPNKDLAGVKGTTLTPTRNVGRGEWAPGILYEVGDFFTYEGSSYAVLVAHLSSNDILPPGDPRLMLLAAAGSPGSGSNGLSTSLTLDSFTLPADHLGNIISYAGAMGTFAIIQNNIDVSSDFSFGIAPNGNPQDLLGPYDDNSPVSSNTPSYAITGGFGSDEDTATLTIRAVGKPNTDFAGIYFDKIFSLGKSKQGTPAAGIDDDPPGLVSNFTLTSSSEINDSGEPWIKLLASWSQSEDEPNLGGYVVAIKQSGGSYIEFQVDADVDSIYWSAEANTTYTAKVRAFDVYNNRGIFTPEVTHTTGKDNTPPAIPTSVTIDAGFQYVLIEWTNAADKDLAGVQIFENTVNNPNTATRIVTVNAIPSQKGSFNRSGLNPNVTRYYWLKSIDRSDNTSAFTAAVSATTAYVAPAEITGQLQAAQLAAIEASKVTGQITGTQITDSAVTSIKIAARTIQAGDIVSGTITGNEITGLTLTGDHIVGNSVHGDKITGLTITGGKIVGNTITGDKIIGGTITGDKISTSTSLPGSITVGNTGVTIETVRVNAASAGNPATTINAGTTQIDPGKITISGGTTLANWRNGGDNTKIDGGNIAANTISANKLTIGNRGVTVQNIYFEANSGNNSVSWSGGEIFWTSDSGSETNYSIISGGSASSGSYPGGYAYIYWIKGEGFLRAGDLNAAKGADRIHLATYSGGSNLLANYGGTVIHGDKISTGTIDANRIKANTILASSVVVQGANNTIGGIAQLAAEGGGDPAAKINSGTTTINGGKITTGTITANQISGNTITADKLNVTSLSAITSTIGLMRTATSGARTEIESNQIRVYDGNNVMRVRIGVW